MIRWALNTLMWHERDLAEVLEFARQLQIDQLDLGSLPGTGHLDLRDADRWEREVAHVAQQVGEAFKVVAVTADHGDLSHPQDEPRSAAVEYTRRALHAAHDLGAEIVGTSLGSVRAPFSHDDHFAAAVASLRELAPAAERLGVRIAVEIHVNDVVNSLERAADLMDDVADAAVGLTFDTSLIRYNRIPVDALFDRLGEHLYHVHIRDADDESYYRIPGRGDFDFEHFFDRLDRLDYAGLVSLELYRVPEEYGIETIEAVRETIAYIERLRVA